MAALQREYEIIGPTPQGKLPPSMTAKKDYLDVDAVSAPLRHDAENWATAVLHSARLAICILQAVSISALDPYST